MRLVTVGAFFILLVLGVLTLGCVSEELQHEQSAQEDPVRPDFLDSGIQDEDLAAEFDAIPDKPVRKIKHKAQTP